MTESRRKSDFRRFAVRAVSCAALLGLAWSASPAAAAVPQPNDGLGHGEAAQHESASPKQSDRVPDAIAAAEQTCISGHLQYSFWDAETESDVTESVASVAWILNGAEGEDGEVGELAQGATDSNGDFLACAEVDTISSASITFPSHSDKPWRVTQNNRRVSTEHSFSAMEMNTVTGTVDGGTVSVPEELAGAWRILDVVNDLWDIRASGTPCWTAHEQNADDCTSFETSWSATASDGGYWDSTGTQRVVLTATDPQSQHVILHEAGHWLQWALHGEKFPYVSKCDPHFIEQPSSPSCAWTEGWSDAVAAHALGDRDFVFADGFHWPLENPEGTAWEGGDSTQGNIGGSLLDLWSLDGPNGSWDANIALMTDQDMPADFKDYFLKARPAAGLPTDGDAEEIINRHGIDYGDTPPVDEDPDGTGTDAADDVRDPHDDGQTADAGPSAAADEDGDVNSAAASAKSDARAEMPEVAASSELPRTGSQAAVGPALLAGTALMLIGAAAVMSSGSRTRPHRR